MNKLMKKIIMLAILAMTVVGCELVSPDYWNRVDKRMEEKGTKCYKYPSGYVHCEDTK